MAAILGGCLRKQMRFMSAGRPQSRGIGIIPAQTPAAAGIPLKHGRSQSKRLGRNPADPEFHALDFNLCEERVRTCFFVGNKCVISTLPESAHLGTLQERS